MNGFRLLSFVLLFSFIGLETSAKETDANQSEKEITKVYYFHKNRRCPTCMAIEKQTRKVLKEAPYAAAKDNKELAFKSMNSENSVHTKLVKELKVSGSALIILKGDEKIDLTNQAFLYARKQPEKFQVILCEALD